MPRGQERTRRRSQSRSDMSQSLRNLDDFDESIFVYPTNERQTFSTNYSKLPDLAAKTYEAYRLDVKQLDRLLAREELSYYATGLLWMKLIDVKAKQRRQASTSHEKDIRNATMNVAFNVPQLLYAYLSQIGNVTDKMGKETELKVPVLPTTVVQGFGGYHAADVSEHTHNYFEEIPSMGIAGDMVMALTSQAEEPVINFHIGRPAGSMFNTNLTGYFTPIGPRRAEIKQRLASQGITVNKFPEFVQTTRFNLKYMLSISDIIGSFDTFRNERVVIPNWSAAGGETQIIMTKPVPGEDLQSKWTNTLVQAKSAACKSIAQMGASYVFGFQLYKEQGNGEDDTEKSRRWCCISTAAESRVPAWIIPKAWIANRNERRDMRADIGTERFCGLSKRQDFVMQETVRRMLKTP